MGAARPILGFVSLILIAGACLLILLVLLGGAVDGNPVNRFYFLEADTSGIAGAAPVSRWTFWNACSVTNGRNDCPGVSPAYPFNPQSNFDGPDDGVPIELRDTSEYYYLTRFMFAFVLIALFFAVCSLFLGLIALCSRIGSFLGSALCSVATFFQTVTAALMTAAYVQGRDAFRANGQTASIGKYNFGFMWAAVACLFLAMILLCGGGAAGGKKDKKDKKSGGRFGRKKDSNRERGSFYNDRSSFEKGERPLPLTNGY